MNIKKLVTPLHILEEKYVAKTGKDWYLLIDRHNESNDNEGFEKCCKLSDIKRNKDDRVQLSEIADKYFSKEYDNPWKDFEKFIEENKNSSNLKAKRLSFLWRGEQLREKLSMEFTGDNWGNSKKYEKLNKQGKKKLLLHILSELSKMKYNSHATTKGKKKMEAFFKKMSQPFASVCEQWYNKDNQQEMFNPIKTYPIEQEDWFKQGYKNKEEWQEAMKKEEEEYYDDCCRYCGA